MIVAVTTMSRARGALVTGGSRGIGKAIAVGLAVAGMDVVVTARSGDELDETAREIAGTGLLADLADPADADALGGRAAEALGRPVDVFVHAAGVTHNARIDALDPELWERAFAVNVGAAFRIARQVVPPMRKAGWGRIVTVCSLYSRMGAPQTAAYASSKHALLGLTRVLSAELAHHGVTANAVIPGWTDTEMVRGEAALAAKAIGITEEAMVRRFLRDQPIGRLLTPEEVSNLTAFLCGDAAGAITGQALHVDGGSFQA